MAAKETTDERPFRERVKTTTGSLWGRIDSGLASDKNGGIHAAVAAVLLLLVSAILYIPLGLPAKGFTLLMGLIPSGQCASTSTSGIASWFCGFGLSLTAMSGALAVIIVLVLLRSQIRRGAKWVVGKLPQNLQFLEKPLVTTIAFAMAWSGVPFHFFTRWGMIIDGLFPAFVGMLMFTLTFFDTPIKERLKSAFGMRERLPKVARLVAVIAIPVLLGYLMTGWMPFPLRDQLAALIGVFVGWLMWTSLPSGMDAAPPAPRGAVGVASMALLLLGLFLLIAIPVTAQTPCEAVRAFDTFAACEAAHHSGTFGGAGAAVAVGATAVAIAPSKDEEEGDASAQADPCESQQTGFEIANAAFSQNQEALELMDQLIEDRQAEYDRLSTSTLISQSVDLAASAWSLGGRLTGWGASTFGGAVVQAGAEILVPEVAKEALNEAMIDGNKLDVMKAAAGLIIKSNDKLSEETIKKTLAANLHAMERERLLGRGLKEGSMMFEKCMESYVTVAETLASSVSNTLGIAGSGMGLLGMYWDYQHMDQFLERIGQLRQRRVKVWGDGLDLKDTFDEAEHQLNMCRYRVANGLEVNQ